jgi:hypothetical protein
MNAMTMTKSKPAMHSPARFDAATAAGGGFLILEALLSLAPLFILGPAIGWPASLDNPAAQQLGAIAAQPGAVAFGYGVYLLYSLLILPAMVVVARRATGDLASPLAVVIVGFAAASTLARSIGILRWLTVMPALATAHGAAAPEARGTIELVFDAVTTYGGGIGELLGVALFMAAWRWWPRFSVARCRRGCRASASSPRWPCSACSRRPWPCPSTCRLPFRSACWRCG